MKSVSVFHQGNCSIASKMYFACFFFCLASGVWHQDLHSPHDSRHAQRPVRSHAPREIPDAGDDVWGGTGAPAERTEKERQTLSPRVALVVPAHKLAFTHTCPQENHIYTKAHRDSQVTERRHSSGALQNIHTRPLYGLGRLALPILCMCCPLQIFISVLNQGEESAFEVIIWSPVGPLEPGVGSCALHQRGSS